MMLNTYIFSDLMHLIENWGFFLYLLTRVFLNFILLYVLCKCMIYLNPVCIASHFLRDPPHSLTYLAYPLRKTDCLCKRIITILKSSGLSVFYTVSL